MTIRHVTEKEMQLSGMLQNITLALNVTTAERNAWIAENSPGGWIDNLRKERDALKAQRDLLYKELNYIAGISTGQVKRGAEQAMVKMKGTS